MCNVTRSKVEGGANDTARCIYAGGALFKEAEVLLPAVPVRGLVPAKGVGSALAGSSVCSYVQPYLPGICSCQGLTYGFDAKCNVQIPNVATLGLQAVVNPCGWSPEASIYPQSASKWSDAIYWGLCFCKNSGQPWIGG